MTCTHIYMPFGLYVIFFFAPSLQSIDATGICVFLDVFLSHTHTSYENDDDYDDDDLVIYIRNKYITYVLTNDRINYRYFQNVTTEMKRAVCII